MSKDTVNDDSHNVDSSKTNYHATYDADLTLEIDSTGKIISIKLSSEVIGFDRCKQLTIGYYRKVEDHNVVFDMLSKNYGYMKVGVEAISGNIVISVRDPVEWNSENDKSEFFEIIQAIEESGRVKDNIKENESIPKPRLHCPECNQLAFALQIDAFGWEIKCSECDIVLGQREWITYNKPILNKSFQDIFAMIQIDEKSEQTLKEQLREKSEERLLSNLDTKRSNMIDLQHFPEESMKYTEKDIVDQYHGRKPESIKLVDLEWRFNV